MWAALGKILANKAKKTAVSAALGNESSQKKVVAVVIIAVALFFLIIFLAVIVTFGPMLMAKQYIEDKYQETAIFFDKVGNVLTLKGWCSNLDEDNSCAKKAEQKFFEQLDETYTKYKDDGVEIDVELLTATIFYGNTLSDESFINQDVDLGDSLEEINAEQYENVKLKDIKNLAKNMVSGNELDYEGYKKYLESTYIPSRFSNLYKNSSNKEDEIKRIANEIMAFSAYQEKGSTQTEYVYYGSCQYEVAGETIDTSQIKVQLVSCDESRELEKVDFEKYIKGVVYGEIGNSWNAEVLKAQAIAARSFALTRNEGMCPGRPNNCNYGYNPETKVIRLRNCEADQVYCDYEKGCQKYSQNGYNSLISGTDDPSLKIYKSALTGDAKKEFENALNDVTGKVLKKTDGKIYNAGYVASVQNAWNDMYQADNSLDYNDILVKHYWEKNNVDLTISESCSSMSGDFTQWKQFGEKWSNIVISEDGEDIADIGCYTVAIAIQFARSGTVTNPNFDPGVFANELIKHNAYSTGGGLNYPERLTATLHDLSNGRFTLLGRKELPSSKLGKINVFKEYINEGKYVVIYVGNHFVALDRIEGDKVYMFDPGTSKTNDLFAKYQLSNITSIRIFGVVN